MFNSPFSQKTLNILKASLPFIPAGMQRIVSNFVKIEEFNIMVKNLNDSLDATISACEYNANANYNGNPFNSNDFISAIKPYLDDREREIIDMLLNMMNALKIYNLYKSFSPSVMPGGLDLNNINFGNGNFDDRDTDHSDKDYREPDSQSINPFPADNDAVINNITEKNNDSIEVFDYLDENNSEITDDEINNFEASSDKTDDNAANQNNFNIETLKNLLTPEQRAMFETYSALLNNNSNSN